MQRRRVAQGSAFALSALGLLACGASKASNSSVSPSSDASVQNDAAVQDAGGGVCPSANAGGSLSLVSAGQSHAIAGAIGANGRDTTGPAFSDPRFALPLAALDFQVFRYPGGTVANYWDWQNGWFQPGTSFFTSVTPAIDNSLGVLQDVVQDTGAAPILVLNMLTFNGAIATQADVPSLQNDQMSFLTKTSVTGLPVQYVELGNEFYLDATDPGGNGIDYVQRFPQPSDYATEVQSWIDKVKATASGAKVAVVGAPGTSTTRATQWNQAVVPAIQGADAITLHIYPEMDDTDNTTSVISNPFTFWGAIQQGKMPLIHSNNLAVWITEFNNNDMTSDHRYAGTWIHAVTTAEYAVLFLSDPNVTEICRFNVINDAEPAYEPGSIFTSASDFGNTGPATTAFAQSSLGLVLATLGAAAARATTVTPFQSSAQDNGHPSVIALQFAGGPSEQAVIVNLLDNSTTIDTSSVLSGTAHAEILSASATTKIGDPSQVSHTSCDLGQKQLELPPFAVARLTAL